MNVETSPVSQDHTPRRNTQRNLSTCMSGSFIGVSLAEYIHSKDLKIEALQTQPVNQRQLYLSNSLNESSIVMGEFAISFAIMAVYCNYRNRIVRAIRTRNL